MERKKKTKPKIVVYLRLFRQNEAYEGPLTSILCTARWNGSEREVLMGFACYYPVLCDSLIGPTVSFHQPLHLHEPCRAALDRFACCDVNFHEDDCIEQAAPLGSGPICGGSRRNGIITIITNTVRTVREVPVALWFGGCGGHFMRPSSLDWQKNK